MRARYVGEVGEGGGGPGAQERGEGACVLHRGRIGPLRVGTGGNSVTPGRYSAPQRVHSGYPPAKTRSGGSYCMPHQGGECSPRVALRLSSHGIGPF